MIDKSKQNKEFDSMQSQLDQFMEQEEALRVQPLTTDNEMQGRLDDFVGHLQDDIDQFMNHRDESVAAPPKPAKAQKRSVPPAVAGKPQTKPQPEERPINRSAGSKRNKIIVSMLLSLLVVVAVVQLRHSDDVSDEQGLAPNTLDEQASEAGLSTPVEPKSEPLPEVASEPVAAPAVATSAVTNKKPEVVAEVRPAVRKEPSTNAAGRAMPSTITLLTVSADIANIRTQPQSGSEVRHRLKRDTQVVAVGMQGDWYRLRIQGKIVWAHKSVFAVVPAARATPATVSPTLKPEPSQPVASAISASVKQPATVTAVQGESSVSGSDKVKVRVNIGNIRSAPETGAKVLYRLKKGTEVIRIGIQGEWYKIRLWDGGTAWAHKSVFE